MSNKYAANHIYSNIGQVPYPFSPYFCIVNKPIEYMETKKTTREEYQKCVNAVVDYINLHLGEEIDLKSLAKISHFSPFYFHRIMKAFLGEPIGTFIVRTRTETAARLLRSFCLRRPWRFRRHLQYDQAGSIDLRKN